MPRKRNRLWSQDDLALLRATYPHVDNRKVAEILGRSRVAIQRIAAKLRLRKTREARARIGWRSLWGAAGGE